MSFVTYAVAARSDGVTMWVVLLGQWSASVAMVFPALLLDSGQPVAWECLRCWQHRWLRRTILGSWMTPWDNGYGDSDN
jgi:hypothetical protein